MAKKPYKYRQARKDARPAAKKAFSGKVKAARKDITGKITAEDRLAIQDMADTAKKELGKKAYLSRADYDAMQNKELEKFRESMREEFGEYGGKKAEKPVKKEIKFVDRRTPAEKEASKKAAAKEVRKNTKKYAPKGSKVIVDTPVTKGGELEKKLIEAKKAAVKPTKTFGEISKSVTAAKKPASSKKMTRAEKSAANKAAWKNMSPAERKAWAANKPGANVSVANEVDKKKLMPKEKVKASARAVRNINYKSKKDIIDPTKEPKAPKRPTLADLKRNEAKGLEEAKGRVAAKNKALANSAKGKTQTPQAVEARKKAAAEPEGKPAVKKPAPKKFARTRAIGKGGVYGAVAGEAVSLAKGSTVKDIKEIQRLEGKLAGLTGKYKSNVTAGRQGGQQALSQLASLATMGVVGKTRRQRMDELNSLISKAEAKKAKANKGLRYGKMGESLVPGTAAYKVGSKTRPTSSTPKPTAGGTTTQVSGSKYTVKKGDTLSGIAQRAGMSLSEVRAINPTLMNNPKYKKGSMIWAGTKVNLKKK